jgi:3-hydroxybutyryl-CoA dehydratase
VSPGLTVQELAVGQQATFAKTLTESDVYSFAGITGDLNPLHVNAVYAEGTRFKQRIVHGMLVASLISTVQATQLPGPGNLYVRQSLKFLAPVYFGDTVTAAVEVTAVDVARNRVWLRTDCYNQDEVLVVTGESELSPRKAAR